VRDISICSVLPRTQRASVAKNSHTQHLAKGAVIATEGQPLGQIASVVEGVVKLTKSTRDGRQQIVGLAFAADLIGRPFANISKYRIEAATDVSMCSFPRQRFEQLLSEHGKAEEFLLKAKLDEVDAARDWMLLLGRKSAEERVATFILMLAEREVNSIRHGAGRPNAVTIELPLTRAEIGDYLGLTLETVSRQFSRLREMGVLNLDDHRRVHVPDVARLTGLVGD
jgi:CRP/FNR family transcriptional regulator